MLLLFLGPLIVLMLVYVCTCSVSWLLSPLSVWPHLFRAAGHEKRRGEQLQSWHLGCTLEVFHVHSYHDQFIQPGWAECFLCI